VIITLYHYAGACIQWWIGTLPAIQIWLNTYMPVEMLSTTDAVLVDANWFEVGLIGYVFLDTLNGLNQGRINMEFWTQLFSEWACVPSAISLSALGASIGAEGLQNELKGNVGWVSVAAPMLLLVSAMVSMGGGMFGLKALGDSTDKHACWTAREKWATMHYFHSNGLGASQEGWKEDVYQLASSGFTKTGDSIDCLFSKVYPLQLYYVAEREAAETQKEKLQCLDKFSKKLFEVRVSHINKILHKIDNQKLKEETEGRGALLIDTHDPEEEVHDFWSDAAEVPWKRKFQIFVVFTLVMAFWGSIVGFYMEVDLQTAVSLGWRSVEKISKLYWFALVYFFLVYNLYNYQYWIDSISSTFSSIMWMATGCAVIDGLETQYQTPEWIVPVEIERQTHIDLQKEFGEGYHRADALIHSENKNITVTSSVPETPEKFLINLAKKQSSGDDSGLEFE